MDMTGQDIEAVLEQQFTGGNGILQIPASLYPNWDGVCNTEPCRPPAGTRRPNIRIGGRRSIQLRPTA